MATTHPGPVVVGVDDVISGREAVVYAAWEAERRGLPLRVVHGYLVPTPCLTPLIPLLDESQLISAANEGLDTIAQVVRARRPGLPLTTEVVRASGGVALVQESASASLVVIGSPRHAGFDGSLPGSVTVAVSAGGHCPVLVVRRLEGDRQVLDRPKLRNRPRPAGRRPRGSCRSARGRLAPAWRVRWRRAGVGRSGPDQPCRVTCRRHSGECLGSTPGGVGGSRRRLGRWVERN